MSKPYGLPALALGLAASLLLSAAASAQAVNDPMKRQRPRTQVGTVVNPAAAAKYRGADKFPAGPVYFGSDYLGDDPDPFIRLQIMRDLGARYPGNF